LGHGVSLSERNSKFHAVFFEHADDLVDGDGAAVVGVGAFEDVDGLGAGDGGAGRPQEVAVAVEGQVLVFILESVHAEVLLQLDAVETEDHAQFGHDALHLVLELPVFVSHAHEEAVEDGVHEHLVPGESVLLVDLERALEEADGVRRKVLPADGQRLMLDVIGQLVLAVAPPGRLAVQQFVEDEAQRPDVALAGVLQRLEDLQRHVERRAHRRLHLGLQPHSRLRALLRKAEVAQLVGLPAGHHVRRLEVPVDDAFADQRQETSAELREDVDAVGLRHFHARSHVLREVTIAEFLDDVVILGALHDVVEADDVLGVHALDDADLVVEGSAQVLVGIDCI
jgi:hypothetical protein